MSRKVRRPNLDTLISQAAKAGRSVKSITFASDGAFTLVFADDEVTAASANAETPAADVGMD
jgi:hypothetical protein